MTTKQIFIQRTKKTKPVSRLASEDRHVMVELEPQILKKHSGYKTKGRWKARFTIASWVRFPEGLAQTVRLVLLYRDNERRKSYKIDACRANRQTLILLNGTVELDIVPEVTSMALVLEGLAEDSVWILDEFNFKPSRQSAIAETPTPSSSDSSRVSA